MLLWIALFLAWAWGKNLYAYDSDLLEALLNPVDYGLEEGPAIAPHNDWMGAARKGTMSSELNAYLGHKPVMLIGIN